MDASYSKQERLLRHAKLRVMRQIHKALLDYERLIINHDYDLEEVGFLVINGEHLDCLINLKHHIL